MSKQNFLIIWIAFLAMWNTANAQSYAIKYSEGTKTNIKVAEVSSGRILVVSCLTDSLFLTGYNGVKEVHVLNNMFLEIVYDTRGGSGLQSRNTVILSVKKNKIHVALLTDSYGKAFGGDNDGSLYTVKFNVKRNDKSNFKLVGHIYDRHKSNSHPQKNYERNKNVTLNFDSVRNIFYSTNKNVDQSFTINAPEMQQSNEQKIKGSFPIIDLGGDFYYYIKDEWYKSDYNHNLFKEYYR